LFFRALQRLAIIVFVPSVKSAETVKRELTDEQQALVDELNQIVRSSDEFNKAAAAGRLMKIPTGDGMALIFYNSPEQPVELEIIFEVAR